MVNVNNLPEWAERIASKCGTTVGKDAFATKSMLDNGQAAMGFGAYLGLQFRAANFPNLTTAPE